jgi:hypothetical protein
MVRCFGVVSRICLPYLATLLPRQVWYKNESDTVHNEFWFEYQSQSPPGSNWDKSQTTNNIWSAGYKSWRYEVSLQFPLKSLLDF